MTQSIFARQALTTDGWAQDVRIAVADGRIVSLSGGERAEKGDRVCGIVIPGIPNAHSHAFQRVLAGHTEHRGPEGSDNFWSWRTRMYALAAQIDADVLTAVARQLYAEMLATGYTAVAEFHYLHREPAEGAPNAMFEALATAARDAGIHMTYVPVLYERAGFEEPEPNETQRRFAATAEELIAHYEHAAALADESVSVGIGAHSLRAVSAESLDKIAAVAARDGVPMHIHISEQMREVEQCAHVYGARPVQWLLDNHDIDGRWCLVHATHMDPVETETLARTGAVVCLCPSTEANLGDGLFPLQAFLAAGGSIAIGSDSHVSINPFEELRWLEYGQRLVSQSRNVAAIARDQTGRSLFEATVQGGAAACGLADHGLAEGAPADLVTLDDDSPMLVGHTPRSFVDALVFSGFTLPIDAVMVNGQWCVKEGRHGQEAEIRKAYADAVSRLDLETVS